MNYSLLSILCLIIILIYVICGALFLMRDNLSPICKSNHVWNEPTSIQIFNKRIQCFSIFHNFLLEFYKLWHKRIIKRFLARTEPKFLHHAFKEFALVIITQGSLATPRRITNTKSYKQNFRATHSDPFLFLVFAWMSWMSSCWEWSIKYHTAFIHA